MRSIHLWALTLASAIACGGSNPATRPATDGSNPPGTSDGSTPTPSGASGMAEIRTGDYHSCARTKDGRVMCWGRNNEGELGDGTTEMRTKPVAVAGVTGAKMLGLGSHLSCALLEGGTVTCWGSGHGWNDGQSHDKRGATQVEGVSDAVGLDAGGELVCARHSNGSIQCWGDEKNVQGTIPQSGAQQLSLEEAHACARLADGTVHCWGGDAEWAKLFADPGVKGATWIATGDSFGCAVVAGGALWCWGRNEQGELAQKVDFDDHPKAAAVPGLSGVTRVAAGEAHACAILSDASLTCWGSNADGELGRGSKSEDPQLPESVQGLSGVQEVELGDDHACALDGGGSVYCWGSNKQGQLGDGTTESRSAPTRVGL